ncbi:hypothetical protein ABH930_002646 [Kitasatospora sp. GAS204A]|uniref:hypothetical protein n=1 Tax=unclassified Kitasatospora TaxID=2633591 RepID=UPI0024736757|nr:hypothetical protein [Kitasatospora sp. GAS204B]MDH6119055.1 hypothetical protein [Kitasatospora sp. GAS204B]
MSGDDVWRAPDPEPDPAPGQPGGGQADAAAPSDRPGAAGPYPPPPPPYQQAYQATQGYQGPYPGAAPGGWPPPWAGWGVRPAPPKPGVIPLAPLGLGDVLSGVFTTMRRYVKPLLLPLLGVLAAAAVLFTVYGTVGYLLTSGTFQQLSDQTAAQPTDSQGFTIGVLAIVGGLLLLLCFLAFSLVASVSSAAVLRHAVVGRPVTAGQLWSQARPHLWRVLGAQLLLAAAGLAAVLVALVPATVLGLLTDSGAVFGVLAVLLLLVVLGLGGYAGVRLTLLVPVVVLENRRPVAAIRRAWTLNHGAWWRSLGIPYLIRMIGSFVSQAILAPAWVIGVIGLGLTAGDRVDQYGDTVSGGPSAFGVVFCIAFVLLGLGVATVLTAPITPLTDGLLYVDRRIRREALADSLAAQVGIPVPPRTPGV